MKYFITTIAAVVLSTAVCSTDTAYGQTGSTIAEPHACPVRVFDSQAPAPCDRTRLPYRSVHWAWPTSNFPCAPSTKARPGDLFNRFYDTRLVPFQRTDSGYCGPSADLRGCLGESRWSGTVRGVEYRFPGTPHSPGRRFR